MRTLFGRLERRANPFENPGTPLTDVGLLDLFNMGQTTDSGVNISPELSLGYGTAWRCETLLAGLVAGFPLKTFGADRSEVTAPALADTGSGMTLFERHETGMLHILGWGNAYFLKVRNGVGQVVDLQLIHPSRVKPQGPPPNADPADTGGVDKVFDVKCADDKVRTFGVYDILHVPGPSLDGIVGMSVVGMAKQAISLGLAADRVAANMFKNGQLLAGVLQTDRVLKQEQADMLKQRWREKVAGMQHAHDVAVLDAGTKFTPIAMPPEDAQFLQSRQWQVEEVSRWFGVPSHLVNMNEKSTSWGKGIEEQNIGLLKFTLRSYLVRFEQRFTREVAGKGQYCEFQVDDLLRSDTSTRYAAYNVAVMGGWITRNEVRRKENLPPLEGLDEPLVPTLAPPATVPAPVEQDQEDDMDEEAEGTNANG